MLIRLIIAHLLTDFVFQSDSWVNQRFKNGWHSKHLYLHGILLVIWILIVNPKSEDIDVLEQIFLPGIKIWVIIAAYLIILWPSSKLISKITEKWREDTENKDPKDKSLEKAGRWIGWLERFLILTFVLLKQYEAIGLLVAAKSIFRFSETRKVGEYVLIGTLLSFVIAILIGLIASLFL